MADEEAKRLWLAYASAIMNLYETGDHARTTYTDTSAEKAVRYALQGLLYWAREKALQAGVNREALISTEVLLFGAPINKPYLRR